MEPTRDWLDYVEALAVLVGVVIALVALLVATVSARDSRRSAAQAEKAADATERTAHAAEETARNSREEVELAKAELARKPKLKLGAQVVRLEEGARGVVLSVVLRNIGDKTADGTTLNVFAPRSVLIGACSNARAEGAYVVTSHEDRRPPPSGDLRDVDWHYVIANGDVRPHLTTPFYFTLRGAGTHRIAVLAAHPEAAGAPFWWEDVEVGPA